MIVYKYLDEKGAEATIKNSSVLLRNPKEYNDPFDCKLFIPKEEMKVAFELFVNYSIFKKLFDDLVENNMKSVRNKLLRKITKANVKLIAKQTKTTRSYKKQADLCIYSSAAYRYLKKTKNDLQKEFEKEINKSLNKIRDSILVSCFGMNNNSILMWSHYANKHRGACVEFEIEDKNFEKVEYDKKVPSFELSNLLEISLGHNFANKEIDGSNDEYRRFIKPLLTKSSDWIYEDEIRCIYSSTKRDNKIYDAEDEKGAKIILLKMPLIKTIYIGCNATEGFIKKIKNISRDIPVKRMKALDDKYQLIVE